MTTLLVLATWDVAVHFEGPATTGVRFGSGLEPAHGSGSGSGRHVMGPAGDPVVPDFLDPSCGPIFSSG